MSVTTTWRWCLDRPRKVWNRCLKPFRTNDEPKWANDLLQGMPEVAESVTTHVLSRPDGVRQRALNAATIAGAAATLLGAFVGLAGLSERSVPVQAVVGVALAAWLFSVFVFLRAIAYSHESNVQPPTVDEMLRKFTEYSEEVRARVKLGIFVAGVAIIFTIASLFLLAWTSIGEHERREPFYVWLAPPAGAAIAKACPRSTQRIGDARVGLRIRAKVREIDLAKAIVVLALETNDSCHDREFRVRGTAVLATEKLPDENKPPDRRGRRD